MATETHTFDLEPKDGWQVKAVTGPIAVDPSYVLYPSIAAGDQITCEEVIENSAVVELRTDGSFTITGATPGEYTIGAEWFDDSQADGSRWQGEQTFTVLIQAADTGQPDAPTVLSAIASAYNQIDLTWTDNADDEDNFTVERSADASTGWAVLTSTLPANTTAYSDTSVNAEQLWYYRVKATNTSGSSGYSNVANATTPAAPPTTPSDSLRPQRGGGKIGGIGRR